MEDELVWTWGGSSFHGCSVMSLAETVSYCRVRQSAHLLQLSYPKFWAFRKLTVTKESGMEGKAWEGRKRGEKRRGEEERRAEERGRKEKREAQINFLSFLRFALGDTCGAKPISLSPIGSFNG